MVLSESASTARPLAERTDAELQAELARAHILKTSEDFFTWARDKSGLAKPAEELEE